jgi:hypothetical protein
MTRLTLPLGACSVFGFLRRCQVVLESSALQRPEKLKQLYPNGLDSVPYHIAATQRATLRHAARLALTSHPSSPQVKRAVLLRRTYVTLFV